MDATIQRLLNDKIYDKRKQGALELENVIRQAIATEDHKKISAIVEQLCQDYAFAWQQPHARNGGLIGLAAAAIALGSDHVGRYLKIIVPPVLACFTDQDARVRYYACESMYNIAKVAKGEILVFFNDIFDSLCKLAADSELSVKNGAELLDRLIKDIVTEKAATYVSMVQGDEDDKPKDKQNEGDGSMEASAAYYASTAFSLPKFIPLLKERIHVMHPLTRNFLVAWVVVLDSVPDLELVTYLPDFLGGFLKFLSDTNKDVRVATHRALDRFLNEIKRVDKVKRSIAESKRKKKELKARRQDEDLISIGSQHSGVAVDDSPSADMEYSGASSDEDGEWIPGQDTFIDYKRILETLVDSLHPFSDDEIGLTSLRWIDAFFDICPEEILSFVPRLLEHVLPAMASVHEHVRQAASRVNASLMDYMSRLPDEDSPETHRPAPLSRLTTSTFRTVPEDRQQASLPSLPTISTDTDAASSRPSESRNDILQSRDAGQVSRSPTEAVDLDYGLAVGKLTEHFVANHEATRVAALNWLILLHRKAPRKVLATNDGTFPALLKTLSDPDEAVVTKDLQLLAQISKNSDDSYFTSFIENVLQLFGTDRKLLEQRGNLIIRQLCGSLNAERIYRTMADCLGREEDLEFATIMVQCLNNNLLTAPQLADLRKRLRNIDNRDGQALFVTLFRSWCYNAVATFSLCLLAQAYEQAYQLLLIMGELEMTVQTLIEIDKLIQLLESPVFTYLRLQLLEPERYPYLYKCLYGLLMLLPQSAAFAALKNRLGSVSAIGYIHTPGRPTSSAPSWLSNSGPSVASARGTADSAQNARAGAASSAASNPSQSVSSVASAVSAARHKSRDEGSSAQVAVRWTELLDRFRAVQERTRRKGPLYFTEGNESMLDDDVTGARSSGMLGVGGALTKDMIDSAAGRATGAGNGGASAGAQGGAGAAGAGAAGAARNAGTGTGVVAALGQQGHKSRSSLSGLTRMARMGKGKKS